jgi:microcystin-dependent protein
MAEWPPTPVTAIPDPPDPAWAERDEVGPLDLIGPTAENQQPGVLDTRTETLRQFINTLVALVNVVQEHFLDRDGADAPVTGSVQGSYFMRGDFDMGGFKIRNLADATAVTDAITVQQFEAIQFEAEDTVEQVADTLVVYQDGSSVMTAPLQMGPTNRRIINLATAAIPTDAIRKDTFDAEAVLLRAQLLPITGSPGMNATLDFDATGAGVIPINVGDPTGTGDLVNKKYLDERVAISASTDVPVGTVLAYAGPAGTIPTNFLLCDGREVSRFTYSNLFNVIGIAYGQPSNANVFKLPNLRGRAIIGLDNIGGQPAGRVTQPAASVLGGLLGVEDVVLTVPELPSHTHDYDDIYYAGGAGVQQGDTGASDADNQFASTVRTSIGAGSSAGHNNVQPSMAQNYIIRA